MKKQINNYTFSDGATRIITIFLFALILIFFLLSVATYGKQMQPDPKRAHQIQIALVEHGYIPGVKWAETQEILRGIARAHGWQTRRTPDARVLILLGLGNEHSDSDILEWSDNRLDYKGEK